MAETPSTPGSASGLRSRPCSAAPDTPSAAPVTKAASARGSRISHTTITIARGGRADQGGQDPADPEGRRAEQAGGRRRGQTRRRQQPDQYPVVSHGIPRATAQPPKVNLPPADDRPGHGPDNPARCRTPGGRRGDGGTRGEQEQEAARERVAESRTRERQGRNRPQFLLCFPIGSGVRRGQAGLLACRVAPTLRAFPSSTDSG